MKTADILAQIERPGTQKQEEVKPVPPEAAPVHPLIDGQIYFQDPRPDLEEDSMLWLQVFAAADQVSKKLQENLWNMRNWGTRIKEIQGRFVLRPDISPETSLTFPDKETYERWRNKLLAPYKEALGEIMKNLWKWKE
jgi:hypothetical protein